MQYSIFCCPSFKSELVRLLESYPLSEKSIRATIIALQTNPNCGNIYPGFGPLTVRKLRIPLPEYRLSSSKGLRFVFLVSQEKVCLVLISIYKKGRFKKEHQVQKHIKNNLVRILNEIESNQCTQMLENCTEGK